MAEGQQDGGRDMTESRFVMISCVSHFYSVILADLLLIHAL